MILRLIIIALILYFLYVLIRKGFRVLSRIADEIDRVARDAERRGNIHFDRNREDENIKDITHRARIVEENTDSDR